MSKKTFDLKYLLVLLIPVFFYFSNLIQKDLLMY